MSANSSIEELFVARLNEIVGEHRAEAIYQTMRGPKDQAYWVNPLVSGEVGLAGKPVVGAQDCYMLPAARRSEITESTAASLGIVYPINPSSVVAVKNLAPRMDEEVLDLAAAPGGKTLLMAAAMNNSGRIAAVEPIKGRFHRMRANLKRCGVTNVEFYLADGRGVGRKVARRFPRVLLDAPCSSESRIDWNDERTFNHWKIRKIKETSRKQRSLIRSAFAALQPGGRLVYCTCAYAPEENECVVDHLLRRESTAEVLPVIVDRDETLAGLTRWQGHALDPRLDKTLRILPDRLWDGFFLCLLTRVA
ncbi:MAG: RsmB/NOP family class I SAM-dependent RNA methyltransferase [Gammaproteobacteria bacterium]|nr:RsmB/NOP family class I SAM-dependent RNA methyltransferase [Gammaproteobacteria bacterium]